MLIEEIKNIKSEKKDLRQFGLTIGIALGLLGGLLLWRGRDYYLYFVIVSLVFIILGLTLPALLRPLQKAWMTFAVILGWFMTRVILSILFYVVFTATGILAKIFGKHFLDVKMDGSKKSYWNYREQKVNNKNDYERQF
ncbi:MAG: hypothetical protein HY755_04060 [Nitrospirae bacterium]|nr:hypothetical protein [Nitrospirota bacterium]MBI4847272.1 hypothetical protein [Nitrospirota bacterium]